MTILALLLVLVYGLCLSFIFCYSLIQVHLTYLYLRCQATKHRPINPSLLLTPEELPRVTIQLPIYNERYVVERLIDAVAAFNYPANKLQIQVLDDSDDETVTLIAAKVAHYQAKGLDITHVKRPSRTGFKAGALQYGLTTATGEFIAIFDADFLPEPDFLHQTLRQFNHPRVGVVQTRWEHLNSHYSLLTKLQAFGLNAHFTIEQTGRSCGHFFINFNGTGGIWRKTCIQDAGGWQADTLTEDLDLSYRAQLRNWEFRYLEQVTAPAELPATMPAVKSQQFRWTKGAAETARKNLGKVLRSDQPLLTKVHAIFHLGNSSIFVCVFLSAVLSLPLLLIREHWTPYFYLFKSGSLFLISLVGLVLFYWTAYRQTSKNRSVSIFTFFPRFLWFLTFSLGLSLHNALAVLEGYLGIKTPFVRTPKFNLRTPADSWQNNAYQTASINLLTILEGLLALYFLAGIILAFYFRDYGLLPFYTMLMLGFGGVFFLTLKHSR
ncbi:cellulose synthase family protein [Adhaeribacter radiodurans]|uniref:Glycosyltransferase n=1 Tax=Adhaeribacter radiodurans TaxID=2745197 RepID=A0A7L7L8U2_9BACT|nr:cellulose synthase family protein [Adhaeribacter radiodurans]QMU28819.1 glycosyltransferase [Adhaeribacter radiodurans]